jgi:hypothetical protein
MEHSARSSLEESAQRDVDEVATSKLVRAARWTRFAAAVTGMSLFSSLCVFVWLGMNVNVNISVQVWHYAMAWFLLLDIALNLMSAAILSARDVAKFKSA